jgi:serine/threonine protein kinase
MCGTPSYLAPEVVSQVDGSGYDNAVDSWSAGVIVFSMLTNTSPFEEDEGTQDIRARILTRQIAWASLDAHAPPFSPDARAFVRALLRTHPAQRLSLTAALRHPWLAGVEPAYVAALAPDDPARAQRAGSLAAITGAGWGLPSQADTESSTGVTNIPGAYPRRRALSLDGDGDSDMADANIGLKRRRAGAGGAGASPTKWRSPEQPPTDEERSEPAPRRSTRNRK